MTYTYMHNALHHPALLYITCHATLYDIQTYIHTCIMPSTTQHCFILLAVPPCMTYTYMHNALHHPALLYITCHATLYDIHTYMHNALHHPALLYITCCATLYDIMPLHYPALLYIPCCATLYDIHIHAQCPSSPGTALYYLLCHPYRT